MRTVYVALLIATVIAKINQGGAWVELSGSKESLFLLAIELLTGYNK